jgi:hypothetical protein
MKQNKDLSKSDSYAATLDMDQLTRTVKQSMNCPEKVARAIAGLISAKIYLELVCKEEDYQEYLVELEEQLDIHDEEKTIH